MKRMLWAAVVALVAAPAWAQSPYVAGAIGAEVIRSTSSSFAGLSSTSSNGDAWSGAIRAGTFLAPRFGLELELLRPASARIEDDSVTIAATRTGVPQGRSDNGLSVPAATVVSAPVQSQSTRVRTTTLSTLAFARQSLGARADLVYLGGLGFSRVVHETEFGSSFSTRSTQYGVGPVVGVEARIAMTTHARLVAGIRLHALGQSLVDGWLLRPAVGLSWSF